MGHTTAPVEEEDRLLTSLEAAAMLGIGESKLRELRQDGTLEKFGVHTRELGYRTLRFSRNELRAYMRNRPRPARSRGRG